MASVNKVILIGNLGRDPETRYTQSGAAVTNFQIATTNKWKDKNGETKEETEWHSITCFGRTAEIAGEYLRKGKPVYIEGRLKTEKWQDKETGADRYSTKIYADTIQFLGPKDGGGRTPAEQDDRDHEARPAQRSQPAQTSLPDDDSDIPF